VEYTENYKGGKISPFYEESTKKHRSNLSKPISLGRKHFFKYVRALNFANIFIARVKFLP
jgi:hypothetical protein